MDYQAVVDVVVSFMGVSAPIVIVLGLASRLFNGFLSMAFGKDESTAVTYIGMSIDELSPYLDRLQASLLGVQQAVFAVGVVLSAWLLYSLFWRK